MGRSHIVKFRSLLYIMIESKSWLRPTLDQKRVYNAQVQYESWPVEFVFDPNPKRPTTPHVPPFLWIHRHIYSWTLKIPIRALLERLCSFFLGDWFNSMFPKWRRDLYARPFLLLMNCHRSARPFDYVCSLSVGGSLRSRCEPPGLKRGSCFYKQPQVDQRITNTLQELLQSRVLGHPYRYFLSLRKDCERRATWQMRVTRHVWIQSEISIDTAVSALRVYLINLTRWKPLRSNGGCCK